MNDYENIVLSAERYALGRMTYIVKLTVDYIINDIEENKLGMFCLTVMLHDLKTATDFGMECDLKEWQKLAKKIEEKLNG